MPYKLKELLDTAIENNSIEGTVLNNKYTFIAPNGNIAQFDSFNSLRDAGIVIDALQAQKDGTLEILNNGHVKIDNKEYTPTQEITDHVPPVTGSLYKMAELDEANDDTENVKALEVSTIFFKSLPYRH